MRNDGSLPTPPELADAIVAAVARYVTIDLGPICAELEARLAEPSEEYAWPRAERLASDAIDARWSGELVEQCAAGLAEAHEGFLRAAATCLEATAELEQAGREARIARAMIHRLAFDVSWAMLTETELLDGGEGCASAGDE
jgi:hypothetical protein